MKERRIYGPPGTGKTYNIIHNILPECIQKYGTSGVIVVSYTKAAAEEIISRLGSKIQTFNSASDDDLCISGIQNTKVRAGTIHSLCYHALKTPTIATGKEVMEEFCKQYRFGKVLLSNNRLETIAYLRNRLKTINDVGPGPILTLWRVWTEFKKNNNYMDFTDLIENCLDMMFAPGMPSAIIIDEAQDMTPLQFKLFRHWNKHLSELIISGDDDQSIYSFIGADASEMIRKDLADTDIHTTILIQSRRLPVEIHKYAKKYIEKIVKREQKDFTSNGKNGFIKNIGVSIGNDKTLSIIIEEARDKTIMILASCDYMLNDIIDKMKRFGVPFSNKYKLDDNRWNPIDAKTLKIINAVKNTQNREDVFLWLKYIKKDLLKRKIVKPTDIEKETFYRSYLEDNLIQVEFDKFEELELKDKMSWFMKSIDHKYIKKFEYAEKVTTGPYKDLKEITVSTVHGVKGREAECVFICPDKSPAMEKSSIFDKSDIIRQFYVAMTRSSCKVYFCTPTKAGIKFKV